jgi:hypothetical protein
MGLGLASPGRRQGGLVGPATQHDVSTRDGVVITATAVTAARPAVAQQRSLAAGDREEKGKWLGGGGLTKHGCGSEAEADRASTRRGHRLGGDRKL